MHTLKSQYMKNVLHEMDSDGKNIFCDMFKVQYCEKTIQYLGAIQNINLMGNFGLTMYTIISFINFMNAVSLSLSIDTNRIHPLGSCYGEFITLHHFILRAVSEEGTSKKIFEFISGSVHHISFRKALLGFVEMINTFNGHVALNAYVKLDKWLTIKMPNLNFHPLNVKLVPFWRFICKRSHKFTYVIIT